MITPKNVKEISSNLKSNSYLILETGKDLLNHDSKSDYHTIKDIIQKVGLIPMFFERPSLKDEISFSPIPKAATTEDQQINYIKDMILEEIKNKNINLIVLDMAYGDSSNNLFKALKSIDVPVLIWANNGTSEIKTKVFNAKEELFASFQKASETKKQIKTEDLKKITDTLKENSYLIVEVGEDLLDTKNHKLMQKTVQKSGFNALFFEKTVPESKIAFYPIPPKETLPPEREKEKQIDYLKNLVLEQIKTNKVDLVVFDGTPSADFVPVFKSSELSDKKIPIVIWTNHKNQSSDDDVIKITTFDSQEALFSFAQKMDNEISKDTSGLNKKMKF